MPLDFALIEDGFMDVLRPLPAFAGWRKKRKRCLWHMVGEVEQGLTLNRYKDSFENRQLVSLGVYVSVPHDGGWPVYVPPEVWDKGRLYRRAYLVPGKGLVSEDTFASGAPVALCEPDDLRVWLDALPDNIERYVAPWFGQYQTLEAAGFEYQIPKWRLQQAGFIAATAPEDAPSAS
ncbi:hypothetical protein [Achromobacter sp. AGC39]